MTFASAYQLRTLIDDLAAEIDLLSRVRNEQNAVIVDAQIERKKLLKSNYEQCLMIDGVQTDMANMKEDLTTIKQRMETVDKAKLGWQDRVAHLAITLVFNVILAVILYVTLGKR